MAWKPSRGNNIGLDKAIKDRHEGYFEFYGASNHKEKSKAAFKWMRGEKYNRNSYPLLYLGAEFIAECKANPKDTYKPLLKIITA